MVVAVGELVGVQVDSGEASQREAGGGALGRVQSLSLCLLAEVEDGGASGGPGQLAGLPSGLRSSRSR